jgi:uncharacterized repeat protein (TIGR03803 family)
MKSIGTILFAVFLWGAGMSQTSQAAGGKVSARITILHSFGVFPNGANPQAPLTLGWDGYFYGTTYSGGTNGGYGTVFRITPGGVLTSLHSFTGGNDGANPNAALAQGRDGIFYGVTSGGGTHGGNGTVFRISPYGALTSLYSFTGGTDGSAPGSLTAGSDGNFYGTTSGTIFRITPGGAFKTLASISGASSLVEGRDGNFYGTADYFAYTPPTIGDYVPRDGYLGTGFGDVFQITPGGVVRRLYSFTGGDDGWGPDGLVQGRDGSFYGTTVGGGKGTFGTVFRITPGGAFATLYSFTNGTDGAFPNTALVQGKDGHLYGTTPGAGEYYDGTFFKITPAGRFTALASFEGDVLPGSALALGGDGNFYATTGAPVYAIPVNATATPAGRRSSGAVAASKPDASSSGLNMTTNGAVFKITPGGRFSNLYSFAGLAEGGTPNGSFFRGSDGNFYGTLIGSLINGGYNYGNVGIIYKTTPGGAVTIMYSTQGGWPFNGLTLANGNDGNLYGTETDWAPIVVPPQGSVFRITPGGQFTDFFSFWSFSGSYGGSPASGVVQGRDGNLYGTATFAEGVGGYGNPESRGSSDFAVNGPTALTDPTIYRLTTNGGFTNLYSFTNGIDGSGPSAALVQGSDGNFYGSCSSGGSNNDGTIFQITPDGAFTSLYSFTNGVDGANPSAALAQGNDGSFYGSTFSGGTQNDGTIFKITTNGLLASLYSFTNGIDGANPQSALVPGSDGNFYGFTSGGGADGYGAIFQITPNGVLTSIFSFAGGNGGANVYALAQGNDGNFYGTTAGGGAGGSGTLFQLSLGLPPLAPLITREPPGHLHEPAGAVLSLSAAAEGMPALNFQWQRNGVDLADGGNISGSSSSALTINPVLLTNRGTYRLIVSNSYAAVTSAATVLTVSADNVAPTISISSPAANARTTNGVISGAAADNARVVAVNYWITNYNNGVSGSAGQAVLGLGTTNRTWTIPGPPLPGSNTVMVQSVDFSGNKSPLRARAFFYEVPSLFTLTQTGNGAVAGTASIRGDAPPTNGAMLHIGESYTLVATPARNCWFSNWTDAGSVAGTSATLRFVMEPGCSLAANFVTNFFQLAAGTYNGLFYSSNVPAAETAGLLKNLVVNPSGVFSGSLLIDGSTETLAGTFNGRFQYSRALARSAGLGGPLLLSLNLGAGRITGAVSGTNNGGWTNSLTAYRSAGSGGSGQYTILIPPPAAATNCPPGDGYVLLTNIAGTVVLTGALADGTPFSQAAPVSESGAVPIYQNLSTNNPTLFSTPTFLFGWINLGANPPGGWLAWVKKTWTEPVYPSNGPMPAIVLAPPVDWQGFTNVSTLIGSPWTNPPAGAPAIPLTNGVLDIAGGGSATLSYTISVNTNNTLVQSGPIPTNSFSGSIDPKTGCFTITFGNGFHDWTFTGAGALLQNAASGGGYFVGFGEGQSGDGSITLH